MIQNQNLELEFRFGHYKTSTNGESFISDIGYPAYLRVLKSRNDWSLYYIDTNSYTEQKKIFRRNVTQELDYKSNIYNGNRNKPVCGNLDGEIIYEQKTPIDLNDIRDNYEYGLRLACNIETDYTDNIMGDGQRRVLIDKKFDFSRCKLRHVYRGTGYEIHLSEVDSILNNFTSKSYELEVEIDIKNLDNLSDVVNQTLNELYSLVHNTELVYSRTQYNSLINQLSENLNCNSNIDIYGYQHLPYNVQPTVVNLKYNHLTYGHILGHEFSGYSVTDKAHGINKLLIINHEGMWLVSPSKGQINHKDEKHYADHVNLISKDNFSIDPLDITIVQGEYIPYEYRKNIDNQSDTYGKYWYWAYDCLFFRGRDIRNQVHVDFSATDKDVDELVSVSRCDYLRELKLSMSNRKYDDNKLTASSSLSTYQDSINMLSFNVKSHYNLSSMGVYNTDFSYDSWFRTLEERLTDLVYRPYITDGLIFTPISTNYINNNFVSYSGYTTKSNTIVVDVGRQPSTMLGIYKWKPLMDLTVDLSITIGEKNSVSLKMLDNVMSPSNTLSKRLESINIQDIPTGAKIKLSIINRVLNVESTMDKLSEYKLVTHFLDTLNDNQPRRETKYIVGELSRDETNKPVIRFIQYNALVSLPREMDKPIKNIENLHPFRTNQVFEFSYDVKHEIYEVNRHRPDKSLPNRKRVVFDNWRLLHDPITEDVLSGRGHRLKDKYFSKVKREMLIDSVKSIPNYSNNKHYSMLDIGSGMGGTVSSMESFTKLILVEPMTYHLPELLRRLLTNTVDKSDRLVDQRVGLFLWNGEQYDLDFTRLRELPTPSIDENVPSGRRTVLTEEQYDRIELYNENSILNDNIRVFIIQAGGQDNERITKLVHKINHGPVDVVSSMLSMSFLWQNVNILSKFIQTITSNLALGGQFIFTTIDGQAVRSLFSSDIKRAVFGDTTLSYDSDEDELIINIPKSIVLNQREWLVNLNHLFVGLGAFGCRIDYTRKMNKERLLYSDEKGLCQLYTSGRFLRHEVQKIDSSSLISMLQECYPLPFSNDEVDAVKTTISLRPENAIPYKYVSNWQPPTAYQNINYDLETNDQSIVSLGSSADKTVNDHDFIYYAWNQISSNILSTPTKMLRNFLSTSTGKAILSRREKIPSIKIDGTVHRVPVSWTNLPLVTIGNIHGTPIHAMLLSSHGEYQNTNETNVQQAIMSNVVQQLLSCLTNTGCELPELSVDQIQSIRLGLTSGQVPIKVIPLIGYMLGYAVYVLQGYTDDIELIASPSDYGISSNQPLGVLLLLKTITIYQPLGLKTQQGIQTIFPTSHSLITETEKSINSVVDRQIQSLINSHSNLQLK